MRHLNLSFFNKILFLIISVFVQCIYSAKVMAYTTTSDTSAEACANTCTGRGYPYGLMGGSLQSVGIEPGSSSTCYCLSENEFMGGRIVRSNHVVLWFPTQLGNCCIVCRGGVAAPTCVNVIVGMAVMLLLGLVLRVSQVIIKLRREILHVQSVLRIKQLIHLGLGRRHVIGVWHIIHRMERHLLPQPHIQMLGLRVRWEIAIFLPQQLLQIQLERGILQAIVISPDDCCFMGIGYAKEKNKKTGRRIFVGEFGGFSWCLWRW